MSRLTPCPSCHSHVLLNERACPHCGASLRVPNARVPAVLIGLALAGCPEAEPVYGVPDTGVEPETDTGMDTGTETGTDAGTDTSGTDTGTDSGTDSVGEPEYGVPDSGA